jgi:hypothetical protein
MSGADDESVPIEAKRLAAFIGDWIAKGTMIAEGNPSAISGEWRFTRAADGWAVLGEMNTDIEGIGLIQEIDIAAFDAVEGRVHLIGMNRFGVRDHIGDWIDPTTLLLVYRGRQDGKEVTEEVRIDFSTPDMQRGRIVEKVGGTVTITTDLVLTRRR